MDRERIWYDQWVKLHRLGQNRDVLYRVDNDTKPAGQLP
jgi:hypothetical protein